MTTIYRAAGDHGALARIRITDLRDRDGQPIATADVTMVAYTGNRIQFSGQMTADDGGWFYDPGPDDLAVPGSYRLEVTVSGSQVTLPAGSPWRLVVRARAPDGT